MKQPVKPILQKYPIQYTEQLENSSYTLKELSKEVAKFAKAKGVDPECVSIEMDESWDDCHLELVVLETKEMFEKRKAAHQAALDKYDDDCIKYKQFLKENQKKERLKTIQQKNREIAKLAKQIKALKACS